MQELYHLLPLLFVPFSNGHVASAVIDRRQMIGSSRCQRLLLSICFSYGYSVTADSWCDLDKSVDIANSFKVSKLNHSFSPPHHRCCSQIEFLLERILSNRVIMSRRFMSWQWISINLFKALCMPKCSNLASYIWASCITGNVADLWQQEPFN